MPVVRLGKQHAGKKSAERHRHARLLHGESSAQHDEQRGRRHHLTRTALCQQPEEWIEQIAASKHDQCNRAGDQADRTHPIPELGMGAFTGGSEQRQHRQQRHDRHVLEQQNGEGTLAVILLELTAFFEDLQGNGSCRHCQSQPGDNSAAPFDETSGIA